MLLFWLNYLIWQRWKDFTDVIKAPNRNTLLNQKGDYLGQSWPNQVSYFKECLKVCNSILLDLIKQATTNSTAAKKWILLTSWGSLETNPSSIESLMRMQLSHHLDYLFLRSIYINVCLLSPPNINQQLLIMCIITLCSKKHSNVFLIYSSYNSHIKHMI